MARSLVEKYEQILASDPASTVFVELAKALIERGDDARAMEVCQGGLGHHPASVVGRVLWGKALINLGRPAEAMEQFDQAIAIDRDNPHAYNLIGEVLLHKGLYRSALPLLRKAVALQPNDGRVRQWLEQTQAALSGGPAPILTDITRVDAEPQTSENPVEPTGDPTLVGMQALPQQDAPTELNATLPADGAQAPEASPPSGEHALTDPGVTEANPVAPHNPEADPFAQVPKRTQSSDEAVIGGLTGTFDALSEGAAPEDPFDAVVRRSAPRPGDDDRGPTVPLQLPQDAPTVVNEPSIAVSHDLYLDGRVEHSEPGTNGAGGLLDDVPPPPAEPKRGAAPLAGPGALAAARGQKAPPVIQAVARPAQGAKPAAKAKAKAPAGGGLLGDIPELEPTSSLEVPKVEVSSQAAEAIAREYERELREKLQQKNAQRSFLSRHWLKLSAAGLAGVVLLVGAGIYLRTLSVNQGSLADALAEAKRSILLDTRESYLAAVEALGRASRMDEDNQEAWALTALAHAVLYAEHGREPVHKEAAQAALRRPGLKEAFPVQALAAQWHLSDGEARKRQAEALLASTAPEAGVQELAGRILLARQDARGAVTRLQRALQDEPRSVRVLVALGDYYRESGDFPKALEFYATAGSISPKHPGVVLGAAECRLELEDGLEQALAEVEALPEDGALSQANQARRLLLRGRLMAEAGDARKGADLLSEGKGRFPERAFELHLALAHAERRAGRMGRAEDAVEAALKLRPKDEEARALLARILIDQDEPRQAVARVDEDSDSRKISLVRGVAYARLGDFRRARRELERTQVKGKFPTEAVLWLSLADADEGNKDQARKVLEKLLKVTRKARGEVLVALGRLHQEAGELDKARVRFEEASKEPDDVEGACAYGRMLLGLGLPEKAMAPLERAAQRNDSHDEAHEALGKTYLMLGRVAEAVSLSERWEEVRPRSAGARRLKALALYQAGRLKEADRAATLAIRADNDSPEAWRTRSLVNFAQGDSRTAFKDLERANKLDPKDSDTFCEIGFAFLRIGNRTNATAAFSAAVREHADSACGQIGLIYAELPDASRRSLSRLQKLEREAPAAWDKGFADLTRSRVLLAVGRPKQARAAALEAIKRVPWSGPAHLALGMAQLRLREDEAVQTLQRAVVLDPVNGNIRLSLGDALVRGGPAEQTKALDEYERFLRIGGDEDDMERVEKTLATLKKRLASR